MYRAFQQSALSKDTDVTAVDEGPNQSSKEDNVSNTSEESIGSDSLDQIEIEKKVETLEKQIDELDMDTSVLDSEEKNIEEDNEIKRQITGKVLFQRQVKVVIKQKSIVKALRTQLETIKGKKEQLKDEYMHGKSKHELILHIRKLESDLEKARTKQLDMEIAHGKETDKIRKELGKDNTKLKSIIRRLDKKLSKQMKEMQDNLGKGQTNQTELLTKILDFHQQVSSKQ